MEHRCAHRIKTDMQVHYITFDEAVHTGRIRDLSVLGARIITADEVPSYGSTIEVRLLDSDNTSSGTKSGVQGFVTWTRNHAFGLIWITEDATSLLFHNHATLS